jgi:hypothetical protein
VRVTIAQNSLCAPGTLETLSYDPVPEVRAAVGTNEHCPQDILVRFVHDPSVLPRRAAAFALDAPDHQTWELWAADCSSAVRAAAAVRPDCPPDIMGRLAADPDRFVLRTIARNPQCPAHLLEAVSASSEPIVLRAVADAKSCPPQVLRQLAASKYLTARAGVAANPGTPSELLGDLWGTDKLPDWARTKMVERPDCPPAVLELGAADKDSKVRQTVAANPACPAGVLSTLSRDLSSAVRQMVAANPGTPQEALGRLVQDGTQAVHDAALANPAAKHMLAMWQLTH